ncbi:MAG: DUF2207 family protein [Bacilli bacterium]
MNSKQKFLFLFIIIGLFFPSFMIVKAENFNISEYQIIISTNENRSLDVSERYLIYFNSTTDNFTRTLNSKFNIIRIDGTTNYLSGKISDISTTRTFSTSNKGSKKVIKIMDTNALAGSTNSYDINYKFNLGIDKNREFDEFYYYLVDGSFNNTISSVYFKIDLPSSSNRCDITFLIDGQELSSNDISYSFNNNQITGFYNLQLNSNQTLAIDIKLDEGYFKDEVDTYNYFNFLLPFFPLITLIISFISWLAFGKGIKSKINKCETVPNDFDTAEIAFLYKGNITEHDVITTLWVLANKGYLKFYEANDGYKLGKPNSVTLTKLKNYEGDNAIQKTLFETIFEQSDVVELKNLEYRCYDALKYSKDILDNKDNKDKIFFSKIKKIRIAITILMAISILILNFNSVYLLTGQYFLIPIITSIYLFGIVVLFYFETKLPIKIIFGICFIGLGLYTGIAPILNEITTLIIYIVGTLLLYGSVAFYYFLSDRTLFGNKFYREILSFKKYLESMNKDQLISNIKLEKTFFYQMYPYTYILGINDIWITKGEKIITEAPSWYESEEQFSLSNFNKFCKSSVYTITQAMFKRQLPGMSSERIEYKKEKSPIDLD